MKSFLLALFATIGIMWTLSVLWDNYGPQEEQDSSPADAAHYSK